MAPQRSPDGRHGGVAVGTMILTADGYQPVEHLALGTRVLTLRCRWRPVTAVWHGERQVLAIRGHGHPGLRVATGQRLRVRFRSDVWRNDIRQYRAQLGDGLWLPALEVEPNAYWATPIEIPALPIPSVEPTQPWGRGLPLDERLLWLAGLYVGDGWTRLSRGRAELVIIAGKHYAEELRPLLNRWPATGPRAQWGELIWRSRETPTSIQFATSCRALVIWLRDSFGHLSQHKRIPAWLYGAPPSFRQAFVEGYVGADGWRGRCPGGHELIQASTVSPALAFGLKTLVGTLGLIGTVHHGVPNDVIGGQRVRARPIWSLRWRPRPTADHHQTFRLGALRWSAIKAVTVAEEAGPVLGLEVDEDGSYVADGLVVQS